MLAGTGTGAQASSLDPSITTRPFDDRDGTSIQAAFAGLQRQYRIWGRLTANRRCRTIQPIGIGAIATDDRW
jgi:hypothetical protein